MAPDGAVLAMVGGRDYAESQFNRATQAQRQPGSLFKIVVYLAALNAGYTPDSVMVDKPVQIGDWQPKNYESRYRGPVTLKYRLRPFDQHGLGATGAGDRRGARHRRWRRASASNPNWRAVPSLALGSAEVTLLEMVRAMDAIAIDSNRSSPTRSARSGPGLVDPLYPARRPSSTAGVEARGRR